jgi:molybdate transport system permease protein
MRAGYLSTVQAGFFAIALALLAFIFLVLAGMVLYPPFDALVRSLQSEEILFAIGLSLVTSVISTGLCALVAIPVAYSLARGTFPGKRAATILLNVPMALPPLVAGVALLIFFGPSSIGQFLENIGISVVFTPLGIIVALFFVNVPYLIRILRSTFEDINPRFEHVARTLGCSEWRSFRRTTLPLAKRGLFAGLVITWSKCIGEFGAVLILAGATRLKTETLPIALFLNMSTGDIELAIAAAIILIAISIASLLVLEYFAGESRFV